MKISIVGTGALGGFYGGRLSAADLEVHCLCRSDYALIREQGLRIIGPQGEWTAQPVAHDRPQSIGPCDAVFICLKSTANDQLSALLPPLIHEKTMLVMLQNGLGNCERLAAEFGPDNVLGGLCFVCLNRVDPGVIHHLAFGKIVLGEFGRPPAARTHALADMLRDAQVPCEIVENLEQSQWEKLVWNIPFNGLGVAGTVGLDTLENPDAALPAQLGKVLPTDRLLRDSRWETWVRGLMEEIIATAQAKGLSIDPALPGKMIENTSAMGEYRASTLVDFERGQPLELESMFIEPLRQARAVGIAVPRLEALCTVLKKL